MGSRLKQREANNHSSLHSEVVALFGRQIVEQAKSVNINQMVLEAELVAEAAKQLRERGHDCARRLAKRGASRKLGPYP